MDDHYYIIPLGFFDIPKRVVLVEIPYCPKNEEFSKRFMKKFNVFTDNRYDIRLPRKLNNCLSSKVEIPIQHV